MTAPDSMGTLRTLPGLMLRNARQRPDKPAMREKSFGIWQTYSWKSYGEQVRDFALGLRELGFRQGDKLCVIGDNRPRLYWAELAAMALGGIAVPVYQDAIASELVFVLNDADVVAIVAENQEQVDKVLSLRQDLPLLAMLIYDDSRGLSGYRDEILHDFAAVQERGARAHGGDPGLFERCVSELDPEGIALMAYTSGTTGNPKGVMLSHANLTASAALFVQNEDVRESDDFLSYLPIAWVGEALYGTAVSLTVGAACNCPEGPETLANDLRELGPTGFVAAPRVWESMLSEMLVKSNNASSLKRTVFRHFRDVALEVESRRAESRPIPLGMRMQRAIGEWLVYGPIRDQLGLRRARWCYTGGAPLGPDTFRFFRAFGVNLKQLYGSTELSGICSLQQNAEASPDNVGRPCPGIEVRLAANGEVLVRGAGTFKGYYKNEAATRAAIDEEGWFRTGDAGVLDARGYLTIIDRAKDVGKLVDGSPFAPQFVENKLKFSPYISEAVSFGHEKPFVCAMIAIDYNTVGNWAERRGLTYTNYMDLSQKPEVRALVGEELRRINQSLPEVSRVRRFLLLAKDLDADDAEVTRTRKLRRGYIAEKYAPVIEAFYNRGQEVDLTTEVTFEDGRKSTMEARLIILEAA